ncbi:MAG TPA: hypothetical protein VI978_01075 [Candidatus Paceibacterota bacterium]
MQNKINKFIHWAPRILSILFVLFLSIFSWDVISPELKWWELAVGLFMHNIPVFILAGIIAISWKREIVGGIAFILAGLLYITLLIMNRFEQDITSWSLIISGPVFLIGILFLVNWFKKKKII